MEYNYPKFTPEMKKTHTILIPNMAITQFRLLEYALRYDGYKCEILGNCGSAVGGQGGLWQGDGCGAERLGHAGGGGGLWRDRRAVFYPERRGGKAGRGLAAGAFPEPRWRVCHSDGDSISPGLMLTPPIHHPRSIFRGLFL